MNETWKDIKGYEGLYQVSNLGRVKSLSRMVEHRGRLISVSEKILKQSKNHQGYHRAILSKNGNTKTVTVHKEVARSFLNHETEGWHKVVDHIDADKSNNCLSNLQIISQKENVQKHYSNE